MEKRIKSVLEQDFEDFNVIILDDCSTDSSVEIIKQYLNHPKVAQVLVNDTNSGSVFKQWQKGAMLAEGTYVWIAESDDYAHPDFLKTLVPILDAHKSVGFVYTDSFIVGEDERLQGRFSGFKNEFFKTKRWSYDHISPGREEIKKFLIKSCTINNASAVLFRKECLVNAIDLKYRYFGDMVTYTNILRYKEIAYIHHALNYYRDHQKNTTKHSEMTGENLIEAAEFYNQISKDIPLSLKSKWVVGTEIAYRLKSSSVFKQKQIRDYLPLIKNRIIRAFVVIRLQLMNLKSGIQG